MGKKIIKNNKKKFFKNFILKLFIFFSIINISLITNINILFSKTYASSYQEERQYNQDTINFVDENVNVNTDTNTNTDVSEGLPEYTYEEPKYTEIPIQQEDAIYIATTVLNVREINLPSGNVLSQLQEGEEVISDGKTNNGWIRVIHNGKRGFVLRQYLERKDDNSNNIINAEESSESINNPENPEGNIEFFSETDEFPDIDEQINMLNAEYGQIPDVGSGNMIKFTYILLMSIFLILAKIWYNKSVDKKI